MFYGDTYAAADDVVGHEMTHGVVDQYSELFYWGQSGAINESMADIMGEIVDHRAGLVAGDANWQLGEDLPIGAIRDMKDPPAFSDPDRMTSPLYYRRPRATSDNGGVHFNSGVGNKTAYLISQGGSFNGQTITGIDGADTGLTKTGKLYFDAITKLTSGSDYANLAAVLEQSCADFVTSGTAGFTAADCANVAKAVLATELRTTPTDAPQPADAAESCPTGTTLRELFNSETGEPGREVHRRRRAVELRRRRRLGQQRHVRQGLVVRLQPGPRPRRPHVGLADRRRPASRCRPASRRTCTSSSGGSSSGTRPVRRDPYIDGGTVEVDAGTGAVDTAALPWVNGPQQTL